MASSSHRPARNPLDKVDIVKCFKQAVCLKLLVCGKTGVGKSALINSLVGREACKINDPGLEGGDLNAGTLTVNETNVNIDNVYVSIYDSPGLQDGTVTANESAYLQDMYDKCNDANLFLYCIEITSSGFTASDQRAVMLITQKFGSDFWKHCVFVMTKANMVRVPGAKRGKEKEYHKNLYETHMAEFRKQLINQGVSKDVADSIPGVAAGCYDEDREEDRYVWYVSDKAEPSEGPVDYLAELWVACFERTASDQSQAKYIRATANLCVKPLAEAAKAKKAFKHQIDQLQKEQKELSQLYEKALKVKEIRDTYSEKNWPAVLPSHPVDIELSSAHFNRMATSLTAAPGAVSLGAVSGATVGGAIGGGLGCIGGLPGAFIGGAMGAGIGAAVGSFLGFSLRLFSHD